MPFWVYFYVILLMDRKLSLASLLSGLELKREKGLACAEKKKFPEFPFDWRHLERGEELCEWLFMSLFGKLSSGLSIYFYNVISNIWLFNSFKTKPEWGKFNDKFASCHICKWFDDWGKTCYLTADSTVWLAYLSFPLLRLLNKPTPLLSHLLLSPWKYLFPRSQKV